MTITVDVANLGNYDATDVTNMVAEAYLAISLHMGERQTEGVDEDIDQIVKQYAVYLLDRLEVQRRAKLDSSVKVPPLMTDDMVRLIVSQIQKDHQVWPVDSSVPETIHWRNC